MSVEFEALPPREKLEYLANLEQKGERLKPKQRALKNRLEKELEPIVHVNRKKRSQNKSFR